MNKHRASRQGFKGLNFDYWVNWLTYHKHAKEKKKIKIRANIRKINV